MRVQFVAAARAELRRAANVCDANKPGLGDDLLAEVGIAVRDIRDFPLAHSPVGLRHRRRLLNRFPYQVVHEIVGGTAWIIAIAHTSRREGYWKRRTTP